MLFWTRKSYAKRWLYYNFSARNKCDTRVSLRSRRYCSAREIKFWRRSLQKRAAKPREIPPARELGYLNTAHFYHLIDLIDLNWAQLIQPIRADNFLTKHRLRRSCYTSLLFRAWRIKKICKGKYAYSQLKEKKKTEEENANDLFRLRGVNLKIKFGHFHKITKHISIENLFIINLQVARSEEARS